MQPVRVPQQPAPGSLEQVGIRTGIDVREVAFERLDEMVDEGHHPRLVGLGGVGHQPPGDLHQGVGDRQAPVEQVDIAPPQPGQLAEAQPLVAHQSHHQIVRGPAGGGQLVDGGRLEPGPLPLLETGQLHEPGRVDRQQAVAHRPVERLGQEHVGLAHPGRRQARRHHGVDPHLHIRAPQLRQADVADPRHDAGAHQLA